MHSKEGDKEEMIEIYCYVCFGLKNGWASGRTDSREGLWKKSEGLDWRRKQWVKSVTVIETKGVRRVKDIIQDELDNWSDYEEEIGINRRITVEDWEDGKK